LLRSNPRGIVSVHRATGTRPEERSMPPSQASHRPHLTIAIFAIAVLAVAGLFSSLATARTTKQVVKEANSSALGKTVLTANNGLTLYSLSVEKHGNFICTGSCLKDWF